MKTLLMVLVLLVPLTLPAPQSPRGAENYIAPRWRFRVTAAPSAASVTLAWDASPSTSVTGYKVQWKPSSTAQYASTNVGNALRVNISGLSRNTTYSFYATAYDGVGVESDPSNTLVYKTPKH